MPNHVICCDVSGSITPHRDALHVVLRHYAAISNHDTVILFYGDHNIFAEFTVTNYIVPDTLCGGCDIQIPLRRAVQLGARRVTLITDEDLSQTCDLVAAIESYGVLETLQVVNLQTVTDIGSLRWHLRQLRGKENTNAQV